MIRLGTTWLVQLASWWFWNTVPRRTSGRRGFRPTWRVGSARQRLDIDSTWTPGRGRATTGWRERARPWPLPVLPAIQRGGHTFVQSTSGRVCSLCQHPERTTCGRCPGASGGRARGAALQFRLDGSAGHRIVDLLQGGKVLSVTVVVWCEVRCSAAALVLRLLGDC